jgi:hypothetical protein
MKEDHIRVGIFFVGMLMIVAVVIFTGTYE